MTKGELDKLRSSTLYANEVLKVRYVGKYNFPKGILEAKPYAKHKSGLPYPEPKWIVCCYKIEDLDGDLFKVADERYGKLYDGFEWVK